MSEGNKFLKVYTDLINGDTVYLAGDGYFYGFANKPNILSIHRRSCGLAFSGVFLKAPDGAYENRIVQGDMEDITAEYLAMFPELKQFVENC